MATPETLDSEPNKVESDRDTAATSHFEKGESPGHAPEAGRAQGRSTKTGPAEPKKRQTEFSVDEKDWANTIPQPGHYAAVILNASISPKAEITYLHLEYEIIDHVGHPFIITEMLTLDAKRTSSRYSQSVEGKGRVRGILKACGKPLKFSGIEEVPKALIGCRLTIAVGHKYVEELPTPKVLGVVDSAEPVKEKP
jgi:hypothetical protein